MRFAYLRELGAGVTGLPQYPLCFHGAALDDRGMRSIQASAACAPCHEVAYDQESFRLVLAGHSFRATDSAGFLKTFDAVSVLLDATTLDVPELLILTSFLMAPGSRAKSMAFLYVEPEGYAHRSSPDDSHGFALSAAYSPFSPIPGFTPELSAQRQGRLLAFLGFEPGRLSRALSPDETGHIKKWSVAFGIPPFQASWEMHSLMRNAEVLNDARQDSYEDVHFVGANDPLAAYDLIESVAKSVPKGDRLVLAPLGTKPASISVALYAALSRDVRLMFDFPQRMPERTYGVGRAHHYGVSLT